MSHFYLDDFLCVDVRYLVAVVPGHGIGPHDGTYWLMCVLDIGGKKCRVPADYPSIAQRDTAFTALRSEYHGIRATLEAYAQDAVLTGQEEGDACGLVVTKDSTASAPWQVRVNGQDGYVIDRWA